MHASGQIGFCARQTICGMGSLADLPVRTEDAGLRRPEERVGYTFVDFSGTSSRKTAELYREVAVRLFQSTVGSMLILAEGEDRTGHYALRDVLTVTLRINGRPAGLKIALVSRSPVLEAFFESVAREFRSAGFDIEFFRREQQGLAWLRRKPPGRAAAS